MRHRSRSITWDGQAFQFQHQFPKAPADETSLWAVFRRGEFIGTMQCSPEVTTRDFDVHGLRWLSELLGRSTGRKPGH